MKRTGRGARQLVPEPDAGPGARRGRAGFSFPGTRWGGWVAAAALVGLGCAKSLPLEPYVGPEPRSVPSAWVDADLDGNVDAVVLEELDPAGLFVKGWVAYRSSRAGGGAAEAWAFRGAIEERRESALEPDAFHLRGGTDRIRAVDAALAGCGLGPGSLARAP